jgi:ankyrin repeat protein
MKLEFSFPQKRTLTMPAIRGVRRTWGAILGVVTGAALSLLAPLLVVLCTSQTALARDSLQTFILAAKANESGFVSRLPELGLDSQSRDGLRNNLLMLALREGGEDLALALMAQPAWQDRAVVEHQNQLAETPLMIAAIKGLERAARRLIELGAEVNRPGWTALHYAATAGSVPVIKLLGEHSAYVDAVSPNSTTPLMMAARFNQRPAAAELIALGADPTITNQSGLNARDYAKEQNNNDLAFWLELEEISFTNRYLRRLPKVTPDSTLNDVVNQVGGEVVTVQPSQPDTKPDGIATDRLPQVGPAQGVEVLPGIR